jgi:hypothetical protein
VAYVAAVLRWLVSLAFVPLSAACHAAPAPTTTAPSLPSAVASAPSADPPASASACRAEPATVYGEEAVVFRIDAPRKAPLTASLTDERGAVVAKTTVEAPGFFRPPGVPSGDFTLRVGATEVSCVVTVNRELTRATPAAR